jgi:hypothetical protein
MTNIQDVWQASALYGSGHNCLEKPPLPHDHNTYLQLAESSPESRRTARSIWEQQRWAYGAQSR